MKFVLRESAFHSLHVGDYSDKVFAMAKKFRNNEKVETFNGRVQYALEENDLPTLVELLSARPGEFARRLDHLLRTFTKEQDVIVDAFLDICVDAANLRFVIGVIGWIRYLCVVVLRSMASRMTTTSAQHREAELTQSYN